MPVRKTNQRVILIDAIRGLAMLGIMLVNLPSINTLAGQEAIAYGGVASSWDQFVNNFSFIFLNSRFYPIFAFLFGLSMAIFMQNAVRKGFNPARLMRRRLGFLALFGVCHILLVWWGDILFLYALFGALVIPCFYLQVKNAFRLALGGVLTFVLLALIASLPQSQILPLDMPIHLHLMSRVYDSAEVRKIYSDASFLAIVQQRLIDFGMSSFTPVITGATTIRECISFVMYYVNLVTLFLFGMVCGLARLHLTIMNHLPAVRRIWLTCLVLIIPSVVYFLSLDQIPYVLNRILGDCFAVFYVCSMILIASHPAGQRLLGVFVQVGQMSLTAYFLHTVFGSLILYSYGLGLYGHVGPAFLVLVALIYYGVVLMLCRYWTMHRGMGPAERLWRWLTYGNLQEATSAPSVVNNLTH